MLNTPRRQQLADAALATIAREGGHGLTHRAVDRAAGMAEGTTSYYFRSRLLLLQAAVHRLAQLDGQMVAALPTGSPEELVDSFASSIGAREDQWLQVARLELTLESTRRPELHAVLSESAELIHRGLTDRLDAAGAADAARRATALLITIDGLVVDSLAGRQARVAEPEHVRALMRKTLM